MRAVEAGVPGAGGSVPSTATGVPSQRRPPPEEAEEPTYEDVGGPEWEDRPPTPGPHTSPQDREHWLRASSLSLNDPDINRLWSRHDRFRTMMAASRSVDEVRFLREQVNEAWDSILEHYNRIIDSRERVARARFTASKGAGKGKGPGKRDDKRPRY